MRIFPNPTSGELRITGLPAGVKTAQAQIFTLAGALVSSKRIQAGDESALNVSDVPKGVYMLKVMYSGQTATHKIIIK